ncbi:MAG: hypothetical protein QG614_92, partial [Patescibacteria group bacterium]|nr:hypothetical protein [Patescibacteria group bacterium]
MNNIRKRKSFKELLSSIVAGDFWFEDENFNKANKKIIRDGKELRTIQQINKNKIIIAEEENYTGGVQEKELRVEVSTDSNALPSGYIRLILKDIDVNTLFLKHNITLKYITANNKMYIKSFILGNEGKEIDCYNIGENESLTIDKENNSIIKIILKEIGGKEEEIM